MATRQPIHYYTTDSENNERLGLRYIPERNELQFRRSQKPSTPNQVRDLQAMAVMHPWTWCYLTSECQLGERQAKRKGRE